MNRRTAALGRAGRTLALAAALAAGGAGPAFGEAGEELPIGELKTLSEVFELIKGEYVLPVSDRELLLHAIEGMVNGLDPHSAYLTAEDYAGLQEGTSGEFGGLGIEIAAEDGLIRIITPLDDSPAYEAGLLPGDVVTHVDGDSVRNMTAAETAKRIRGAPGTAVTLTIVRAGEDRPLEFTIVRDIVEVASVKYELFEPGFAQVRITRFQPHTGARLLDAIRRLEDENGGPLDGVVLDLRNNPGGLLSGAVAVADAFLSEGLIVYTEGRDPGSREEYGAGPPDELDGAPIVVLVNGGSASAAEIVAGALQDQRRAVVVGARTFGKGSIQAILPLDDESALMLTTARYYTPAGHSIQARGIVPDIVLPPLETRTVDAGFVMREGDLPGHLESAGAGKAPADTGTTRLAFEDFPLFQAFVLLKGLALRAPG